MIDRTNDRVVLAICGDDVVAFGEQSEDDEVERVGGVVAEAEALGTILVSVKELGETLAETIEQRAGFDGQVETTAAGIDTGLSIELQHEVVNVLWLGPNSGSVVEINELIFHGLRLGTMLWRGAGGRTCR